MAGIAVLTAYLQTTNSDAVSEFGGAVRMPAPSQAVIETLRHVSASVHSQPDNSPVCAVPPPRPALSGAFRTGATKHPTHD